MPIVDWILFPIVTFAATLWIGTQVLFALAFNLPWAIWNTVNGRLRLRAVFLQAATPALWLALLAAAAWIWARLAPQGLPPFLGHPGPRAAFIFGLAWLGFGMFSAAGRQERAEDRTKYRQLFGK